MAKIPDIEVRFVVRPRGHGWKLRLVYKLCLLLGLGFEFDTEIQ